MPSKNHPQKIGDCPPSTIFRPNLALCNFISDTDELRRFAIGNGFAGIDWSFEIETLPSSTEEEGLWVNKMESLNPLKVRYHCPFKLIDIGHENRNKANEARSLFEHIITLVSRAGGQFTTIHIGLGQDTTMSFSWMRAIENLQGLVQFGRESGVTVCLENLAWGWTSKPNLFEKLIRKTGAYVTFDIGHAYACEAIQNHYYSLKDFVFPHADRVVNAHLYHTEIEGQGHLPPSKTGDMTERLQLLYDIRCPWWVIEMREFKGLMQTKSVIDTFLKKQREQSGDR